MNELGRRDLLVSILQALLLTLFPWLRQSPRGLEVAKVGAETIAASGGAAVFPMGRFHLTVGVRGVELTPEQAQLLRSYDSWPELMKAAGALNVPKVITIDDSAEPATIAPGTWDMDDATFAPAPLPTPRRVLDLDD